MELNQLESVVKEMRRLGVRHLKTAQFELDLEPGCVPAPVQEALAKAAEKALEKDAMPSDQEMLFASCPFPEPPAEEEKKPKAE